MVPHIEGAAWDGIGYILPSNTEIEKIFDVDDFYGTLAEGKYRVVKKFFSDEEVFAVAEFEVV